MPHYLTVQEDIRMADVREQEQALEVAELAGIEDPEQALEVDVTASLRLGDPSYYNLLQRQQRIALVDEAHDKLKKELASLKASLTKARKAAK